MTDRRSEIDVAKGLGIVLVVVGHSSIAVSHLAELVRLIYYFHVPLFFFLTGYSSRSGRTVGSVVNGRGKSLLVPYFFFLILFTGLDVARGKIACSGWEDAARIAMGVVYGVGDSIFFTPLWFLLHLFLVCVIAQFMVRTLGDRLGRRSTLFYIFGLYSLGVVLLINVRPVAPFDFWVVDQRVIVGFPWSLDLAPISLSFFFLGKWSRFIDINGFPRYFWIWCLVGFLLVHYACAQEVDLNRRLFSGVFFPWLLATLGIACVFFLSVCLLNSRGVSGLFAYLGGDVNLYFIVSCAHTGLDNW